MNEVKYFVGEFDRINEGLENRSLNANNVISIIPFMSLNSPCDIDKKQMVVVYYKEYLETPNTTNRKPIQDL